LNSLVFTFLANIKSSSSNVLPFVSGTLSQHHTKQTTDNPPIQKLISISLSSLSECDEVELPTIEEAQLPSHMRLIWIDHIRNRNRHYNTNKSLHSRRNSNGLSPEFRG
jgi:hypothetical protein